MNEQQFVALTCANQIRTSKAGLKRQIASGEINPIDVILETELPLKAHEVVRSIRGIGNVKAHTICKQAGVSPTARLAGRREGERTLSDPERARLAIAAGRAIERLVRSRELVA